MTNSVQLPIVLQQDRDAYMYYGLPLCVLLAHETLLPWYYENFVDIGISYHDHFRYQGIDFWASSAPSPFSYENCSFETLELLDPVAHIKKQLSHKKYAYINLDEYYIPDRPSFERQHFVHDFLIYGFDDQEKRFSLIALKPEGKIQPYFYSYETILDGLRGGRIHDPEHFPITFFKLRKITSALSFLNRKIYSTYPELFVKRKYRRYRIV